MKEGKTHLMAFEVGSVTQLGRSTVGCMQHSTLMISYPYSVEQDWVAFIICVTLILVIYGILGDAALDERRSILLILTHKILVFQ